MGTWVIFVLYLLINQLVNVAETFTHIFEHYFFQSNIIKFANYLNVLIWGEIVTSHLFCL